MASLPDKPVHFAVYVVLGACLAHARYHGAPRAPHVLMIALGAAYGATDEWHQSMVPGRVAALDDWLADLVGVAAGYVMAWLIVRALTRRRAAATTGMTQ